MTDLTLPTEAELEGMRVKALIDFKKRMKESKVAFEKLREENIKKGRRK